MRVIDIPESSQLSTPKKIILLEDLWEKYYLQRFQGSFAGKSSKRTGPKD